jgi:hypothetical protein
MSSNCVRLHPENRHKKPENNADDDRLFDGVGTSWDSSRHAEIPKAILPMFMASGNKLIRKFHGSAGFGGLRWSPADARLLRTRAIEK